MNRLPDFVIIGAMKAGTTTLFRWLGEHPDCALPHVKEPHFFARDDRFARGLEWYGSLFPQTTAITGEASADYADPAVSRTVADRMATVLPDARIIMLVREPEARLRSHYVHEVQRGREHRPFQVAVADPASTYVRCSRYHEALRPFLGRFRTEQIHVVAMETLNPAGWTSVLPHLRLAPWPCPGTVHNSSTTKPAFTPAARWLWERGLLRAGAGAPRPLRRLARTALVRTSAEQRRLVQDALTQPVADASRESMSKDAAELCRDLGSRQPPWDQVPDRAAL